MRDLSSPGAPRAHPGLTQSPRGGPAPSFPRPLPGPARSARCLAVRPSPGAARAPGVRGGYPRGDPASSFPRPPRGPAWSARAPRSRTEGIAGPARVRGSCPVGGPAPSFPWPPPGPAPVPLRRPSRPCAARRRVSGPGRGGPPLLPARAPAARARDPLRLAPRASYSNSSLVFAAHAPHVCSNTLGKSSDRRLGVPAAPPSLAPKSA